MTPYSQDSASEHRDALQYFTLSLLGHFGQTYLSDSSALSLSIVAARASIPSMRNLAKASRIELLHFER
jgi:hypothetical protein